MEEEVVVVVVVFFKKTPVELGVGGVDRPHFQASGGTGSATNRL
jgi:hypothetical protein